MRLIASSLMAGVIALGAVAPAFADPPRGKGHGGWDDHRGKGKGWNDDRRDDRGWRGNDRGWDDRRGWDDHRGHNDRWGGRGWYDSRGDHRYWSKGDYFRYRPSYSNFVVVRDYGYYRLPPPRHGQYYYRDNRTGEILLVAAATGLILWALNN